MATPLTPAVSAFDLTTLFQTLYTVPATNRAGIDAVVFNNYSFNNITIDVRIIQSGTSSSLNEIITNKTIRGGESFLAPAMIGQAIQAGGTIEAKASAVSSVNANITVTLV